MEVQDFLCLIYYKYSGYATATQTGNNGFAGQFFYFNIKY